MANWREQIQKNGNGNGNGNGSGRIVLEEVLEALENPQWDLRTVAGISRDTGLSDDQVIDALDRAQRLDIVRVSNVPGPGGSALYALTERPATKREWLAETQAIISRAT
jgi:hypothetical protein